MCFIRITIAFSFFSFSLSLSILFFSSILCNSRRTLFEVCMPFTLCTHLKCKNVYKARDATVYWPTCCILWAMYKYCCARLRGCCHRFNIVCMPSYIYIRFLLHSLDIRFGVFYCLFFTFWCFPGYMGVCVFRHLNHRFELIFDDMQFRFHVKFFGWFFQEIFTKFKME